MSSQFALIEGVTIPSDHHSVLVNQLSPAILDLVTKMLPTLISQSISECGSQSVVPPLGAFGQSDPTSSEAKQMRSKSVVLDTSDKMCPASDDLLALLISELQQCKTSVAAKSQEEGRSGTGETDNTLRIRIAVLENELKHSNQERDGLVNGLTTIVGVMANGLPNRPTPKIAEESLGDTKSKELEQEIERLRMENRKLRTSLRELRDTKITNTKSDPDAHKALQSSPPPGYASDENGKHEEVTERKSLDLLTAPAPNSYPTPTELAGSWAAQQQLLHSDGFEFGIGIGSGEEPSMSNFPNNDLYGTDTPLVNDSDIQFSSLEDILDCDAFAAPLPTTDKNEDQKSASSQEPLPQINNVDTVNFEEEKTIDEQVEDQRRAMEKFNSRPAPGVLKVGGTIKDSFRGKEYDSTPSPLTAYPTGPRGWRADENHQIYKHQRNEARDFDAENVHLDGGVSDSQISFPNPTWRSAEEREDALKEHAFHCGRSKETRFPDFFRYGIQYMPGELDSNFIRTVHMENLPADVELREVLARVRGGEVISAVLLDTRALMGSLSARIVFKNEGAAEEYVTWAASHPILFTSHSDDTQRQAKLTLIQTPTYPPNPGMKNKLQDSSRCICIPDFPRELSIRAVERDIACRSKMRQDALLEISLDADSTLHMEFASIDMAGSAMGILNSFRSYRECEIVARYEPDPCAGPLEELLLDVQPRPRMLPDSFYCSENFETEIKDVGGRVGNEIMEEKTRPANLKTIVIPSFSGRGLGASSWADEVNDELEAENEVAASCSYSKHKLSPQDQVSPDIKDIPPCESASLVNENNELQSSSPSAVAPKEFQPAIDSLPVDSSAVVDGNKKAGADILTGERMDLGAFGLAGSKYATRIPSFSGSSKPRPRLSPLSQEYPIPSFYQKSPEVPSILISSPPRVNLEDLIGEDEDEESGTEGEATLALKSSVPALASESENEIETTLELPASVSALTPEVKVDIDIERSLPRISRHYDTCEQRIDEANLAMPFTELDLGQLERIKTPSPDVESMGSRENSTALPQTGLKLVIESTNPAFRATNMNGGTNPDEIALELDSDLLSARSFRASSLLGQNAAYRSLAL